MSPRSLAAGTQASIASESAEFVHLLEFQFLSGTVRLCTGAQDLEWVLNNLLVNPSFETDSNADGLSDSWVLYNNGAEAGVTTTRPLEPYEGTYAQRVTWANPNGSTKGFLGAPFGYVSGQYYIISFAAKATGGGIGDTPQLYWNNAPNETIGIRVPPLTANYQWYVYKIKWTTNPLDTVYSVYLSITNAGGQAAGSLTVDAFRIGLPIAWEAVGGLLELGGIEETTDARAQGVDVKLSGVDQTILAVLLTSQYRGRVVKIWRAHLDRTTGLVVAHPILLFQGLQLSPYTVDEEQTREGGTVRISTRLSGYFGVERVRGIVTNLVSHQHHFPGDTFFQHSASLANIKVYWGTPMPMSPGNSSGLENFHKHRK